MSNKELREMELLSAYLDDELDAETRNRVGAFLTTSPEGRRALEELRHTKHFFATTPRVHAPSDFLDMLESQAEQAMIHQEKKSFWSWSNPFTWVSVTATAGVTAFVVMTGLHSPREISYRTLLAAHAGAQGVGGVHQSLMSASHNATLYDNNNDAKV